MTEPKKLTTQELEVIGHRAEEASPAPWRVRHRHVNLTEQDDEQAGLGLEIEGPPEASSRGQFARAVDARFIAYARQDIPALLAHIAALEAKSQQRKKALKRCGPYMQTDYSTDEKGRLNLMCCGAYGRHTQGCWYTAALKEA